LQFRPDGQEKWTAFRRGLERTDDRTV
jgi:hypothetical protein